MFLVTRTDTMLCAYGVPIEHATTSPLGVFDTRKDAERYILACKACEGSYKARYAVKEIAHNLLCEKKGVLA